jgi:hypothetical protein
MRIAPPQPLLVLRGRSPNDVRWRSASTTVTPGTREAKSAFFLQEPAVEVGHARRVLVLRVKPAQIRVTHDRGHVGAARSSRCTHTRGAVPPR